MSSLRERNRRATIELIQDAAFTLFDRHDYNQVTIAQICAEAEVSESTFYRLFGTKEGLFTATPWEPQDGIPPEVDATHLAEAIRTAVSGNEFRGMKWVANQPEVRSAVLSRLDELSRPLIDAAIAAGTDPLDAALTVRHLLFGVYLTGLEQWYQDGQCGPFEPYYDAALAAAQRN